MRCWATCEALWFGAESLPWLGPAPQHAGIVTAVYGQLYTVEPAAITANKKLDDLRNVLGPPRTPALIDNEVIMFVAQHLAELW